MTYGINLTEVGSSPLTRGKPSSGTAQACHIRLIPAHAGKTLQRLVIISMQAAHPRSRGENHLRGLGDPLPGGSSPLTRGKRGVYGVAAFHERLIPAHAGKTASMTGLVSMSPAHPRSRGENRESNQRRSQEAGSSPLTRGKP